MPAAATARVPPSPGRRTRAGHCLFPLFASASFSPESRCPGCDESSEARLPSFSAPEFLHLRLQACDTCRAYLPMVDMARDPLAVPEVDELAGLPLDIWAAEQGYHKLQPNLAGI